MAPETEPVHRTWLHSDRMIPRRFVRPARRFMATEAAGGIVLLIAAVIALVWANSAWGESYFDFWSTTISFEIGDWFHFEETLKAMVNDGLMAIFFFVVGLEIKRELVVGELSSLKRAALPGMAALGGMVIPALIYIAIVFPTVGGEATRGWGIPMATDIAFSLGVIALLGARIAVGAKLFLLALAIADDVGAILVIAIFYTRGLSWQWIAVALIGLGVTFLAQKAGIRSLLFYVLVGVAVWLGVLESGVHATIAGVVLGLMAPVRPLYAGKDFRQRASWILERYDMNTASPQSRERLDHDARELAAIANESISPLDRLEHALHNWSAFFIVPVFALANAGVRFIDAEAGTFVSPVMFGVMIGLVLGKPIGITAATWLGLKLRLGELPRQTNMRHILGLGVLAGIGFTVSLFITELAFTDLMLSDEAKIGIFIGSAAAGIAGYLILRTMRTPREELEEARDALPTGAGGD